VGEGEHVLVVRDGFGARNGVQGRWDDERGAGDDHERGHQARYLAVEYEEVFAVAAGEEAGAEDLGEDLDMDLRNGMRDTFWTSELGEDGTYEQDS